METPKITTEEELTAWEEAHPWGDQDENGVSLDQLRENLRLTPLERLLKLENSVASLWELRKLAGVTRRA